MKLKTSNRNWNKNQQIVLLEKDYAPKTLTVCNDDTARMHAEKKNSHAGSNGYFYVSQVMSYYTYTNVTAVKSVKFLFELWTVLPAPAAVSCQVAVGIRTRTASIPAFLP
jgi:hypothetical protein